MIVRELITRLGFRFDKAQADKAAQATNALKRQAESTANSFRTLATTLVSAFAVQRLVAVADEMQNIRSRIGMLPQTVGDVGAAFDEAAKHASAAGVSIEAYTSLYTRVGNAAKDYIKTQEDLLGITDTISKALVVGGASTQEASAVMTQFSQALASGVLQGDEFRSMAEAAPQYLDKLSEAMGIPREQLKKMASDGKLTAKAVIEATRTMEGYFSDKFRAMPMTVGRAVTTIKNDFAAMIDRMNRETQIIPKLAKALLSVFDAIRGGLEKLVKAMGGWENALRFVGIALGVAFGAKAISMIIAFGAAGAAALAPFLALAAVITAVALVLEDVYVWATGGKSAIGKLIGPWSKWGGYVLATLEMIGDLFGWIWDRIKDVANVLSGILTLDWDQIKTGLGNFGKALWDIAKQLGRWFWESVTGAWNSLIDWLGGIFSEIGTMLYDNIFKPIVEAVAAAFEKTIEMANAAWDGIQKPGEWLGGKIFEAKEALFGDNQAQGVAMNTGAAAKAGTSGPTVNTTVNVTVPPGSTPEQVAAVKSAAGAAINNSPLAGSARAAAVYHN